MHLLEEFCNKLGIYGVFNDNEDIDYTIDNSSFNSIDVEEADYGVIKYNHTDQSNVKHLIAVKIVYGGDIDQIEFTVFGRDLLTPKVMNIIKERLATMNLIVPKKIL